MISTSGTLSYVEINEIVEILVNTEGRKYPIPGLDRDDIAQEIRLECFRVLPFYDASRIGPSPYKYLQTCVKNFLYNMRRGIWVPNNPPCARCPLWDKTRRACAIDEVDCERIVKYRENMAARADLRAPISLENDSGEQVYNNEVSDNIEVTLLDQSIRDILPKNLISYYETMLDGGQIPPKIKKQIRVIVVEIINNAKKL